MQDPDDERPTDPAPEGPPPTPTDPEALKSALGRTGKLLQTAGLPFEADEFEDDEDESSTSSSSADG